jgi:cell division septum initiation protein DivIVA
LRRVATEVEQLQARVAELERELAERTDRANAAVAAAEDRLYWLDAWRIDLDAIMARPAAQRAYAAANQLRRAKRLAGRVRRRLKR